MAKFNLTEKEAKLLRLALDKAAPEGEAANAWIALLKSLRARNVTGYDVEDGLKGKSTTGLTARDVYSDMGRRPAGRKSAHERAKKAAAARWGKKYP